MFMFRQRDHGSIAALAAIAAGEVPPPASPDYHEFCVNIASAVQLTTRRHHLRHLQVLAWFEAMEHRSMINACIWGLGPAWLHLVAKYPATKKVYAEGGDERCVSWFQRRWVRSEMAVVLFLMGITT